MSIIRGIRMNGQSREIAYYLLFGVCTTLVNWSAYLILTRVFSLEYLFSTVAAWIAAVLFAFATNKFWVFASYDRSVRTVMRELTAFTAVRILSGSIDLGIMWIGVEFFQIHDLLVKIAASVFVVIMNYLLSKRVVFTPAR
jgi:putative flippase GtrA